MASLPWIAYLFAKREKHTFAHFLIDNPWERDQDDKCSHGNLASGFFLPLGQICRNQENLLRQGNHVGLNRCVWAAWDVGVDESVFSSV